MGVRACDGRRRACRPTRALPGRSFAGSKSQSQLTLHIHVRVRGRFGTSPRLSSVPGLPVPGSGGVPNVFSSACAPRCSAASQRADRASSPAFARGRRWIRGISTRVAGGSGHFAPHFGASLLRCHGPCSGGKVLGGFPQRAGGQLRQGRAPRTVPGAAVLQHGNPAVFAGI